MKSRSGILNIIKNANNKDWYKMEHFPHRQDNKHQAKYLKEDTVFQYVYEHDVRLQIKLRPHKEHSEHSEHSGWNEDDLISNYKTDSCYWSQLRVLYDRNLVHLDTIFRGDKIILPNTSAEFTDDFDIKYEYLNKEKYELACGLSHIIKNPDNINTSEEYLESVGIQIKK